MGVNSIIPNPDFWYGRSVFLTGHTGFKGGWIALWLSHLGARVHGYSLSPPTRPSFFQETQLQQRLASSTIGNINDLNKLFQAVQAASASVVIHLAAQSLVRESYNSPVETFATNVLGTVNVLEVARSVGDIKAVLCITTDKCYENREWIWPYRENDRLGGHDPYSSSKACAELAASAYRYSFLEEAGIQLATARAGNVIGGGDWATDRLVPDFLRAMSAKEILKIRFPNAIRPWQHVLEPLSGYLVLAEKLLVDGPEYACAWNFGPEVSDTRPVSWVIQQLCEKFPGSRWRVDEAPQAHEATLLKLDSTKAKVKLGWAPRWTLETALEKTVEWYLTKDQERDMADFSIHQIKEYSKFW